MPNPVIGIGMAVGTASLTRGLDLGKQKISEFAGSVQGLGGRISGGISSTIGNFAKLGLAVQGVTALVRGIGSVVSTPLSLAAAAEQTEVSFKVLTGSAESAQKVLGELRTFGAETPFEFPEIAESAKKLIAFGFNANTVTGNLRRLGDIGAGLGIPLSELSDVYGKIAVQGKVQPEDLNQLSGKGIPIVQELSKVFGVAESKVRDLTSSGKVNFSHIQTAIENLTNTGGKFSGLMAAQSTTLGGLWSTLNDNISLALTEIGLSISETFNLKGAMDSLNSFIGSATPMLKGFLDQFKSGINAFAPILIAFGSVLKAEFTALYSIVGSVFSGIVSVVSSFLPTWEDFRDTVLGVLITAEYAWTNWAVVGEIALKQVASSIIGFGGEVVHTLSVRIPTVLVWFWDNWTDIFDTLFSYTTNVFANLGQNIVNLLVSLPGLISGSVSFEDIWTPLLAGAKNSIKTLPEIPERVMGKMEKTMRADVDRLTSTLGEGFADFKATRLNELIPKDSPLREVQVTPVVNPAAAANVSKMAGDGEAAKLADAALFGSMEARQTILRNQMRASGMVDKEPIKVAKDQLSQLKEIKKAIVKTPSIQLAASSL